jgi:hypothetical protein
MVSPLGEFAPSNKMLDWLLEPTDPSPRYRTLTQVLGCPEGDPQVLASRTAIPQASLALQSLLDTPPDPGLEDPRWFRLTFPLAHSADLLQWLAVLVEAGFEDDPILDSARLVYAQETQRRPMAS